MGIKVEVQTATPTPQGLRLGVRIEHEQAGWIRFNSTILLYETLGNLDRLRVIRYLESAAVGRDEDLDVPLF